MKISNKVHQIRIHFQVTEEVQRYVYVYLITGKNCYLIDAGIAGCEKIVAEYMQRLGEIHYCCPAWDRVYQKDEWKEVLQNARMYLQKLKNSVLQIEREYGADSSENRLELLGVLMGWKHVAGNPLFKRSIAACRRV